MRAEMLLEAIGLVDERYVAAAEFCVRAQGPARHPLRRAVFWIAAAVILLAGTFATAMAVNETFRETVFSFLRIQVTETVPPLEPGTEGNLVGTGFAPAEIGETVRAEYVWLAGSNMYGNGLLYHGTEPATAKRGGHYALYTMEDGMLYPVETKTIQMQYERNGRTYLFHLEWGAWERGLGFAYIEDDGDNGWHMKMLPGRSDMTLLMLEQSVPAADGETVYAAYPMLFDLENALVIDFLDGCGVERLPDVVNAAVSEDCTGVLLAQQDGTLWYCNTVAKTLSSIDVLSGRRTEACSLLGETLACWAREADGSYTCWNIDLSTSRRTAVFQGIPAYSAESGCGIVFLEGFNTANHAGYAYSGACFALEVQADRTVVSIDLRSGARTEIAGFVWPEEILPSYGNGPEPEDGGPMLDMGRISNPTGTRVLLVERDYSERGYRRIGVLDYASGCYIELERENFRVNEYAVDWFDAGRVIVTAGEDGTGNYNYIYTFDAE